MDIVVLQKNSNFVFELRNTQFVLMAFRLLLLISKTTKLLLRTHNRHTKCSRPMSWVVLMFVWVLGRTFLSVSLPTLLF